MKKKSARATPDEEYNKILLSKGASNKVLQVVTEAVKMLWEAPTPFLEQLIAKSETEPLDSESEVKARETIMGIVRSAIEIRPALIKALNKHCPDYDWEELK